MSTINGDAMRGASLGIQASAQNIQRSGARIASAENMNGVSDMRQLTEALLTMKNAELQAKAGIKALQTADQMFGSLFDDHA